MTWTFLESQNGEETIWRDERSLDGGTIHVTGTDEKHVRSEAAATEERLGLNA